MRYRTWASRLFFLVFYMGGVSAQTPGLSLPEITNTLVQEVGAAIPHPRGNSLYLSAPHQALELEVSNQGAQLRSLTEQKELFQLLPVALGKGNMHTIRAGEVSQANNTIYLNRADVSEIFSASVEGIRQDFLVHQAPLGQQKLRLELDVSGATVSGQGQRILLTTSNGRELVYNRLHITDADGRVLEGKMRTLNDTRLQIEVDDRNASYPLLIDPTISDADWVAMSEGMRGANGSIKDMLVWQGKLYLAGDFTMIGDIMANRIAAWDGNQWFGLAEGVNAEVSDIEVYNNQLVIAGRFTQAGNNAVNHIGLWDGSQFQPLGEGVNAPVNALAILDNALIVGGLFTQAGGGVANKIARWENAQWSTLGASFNGDVWALGVHNSLLYAGGAFTASGVTTLNHVAEWDGSAWQAMGQGFDHYVYTFSVFNNQLVAGGRFWYSGSKEVKGLATWDGLEWTEIGDGVGKLGGFRGSVYTAKVWNNKLLVGGTFHRVGGSTVVANIASWDGTSWDDLYYGIQESQSYVSALAVFDGKLVVGGAFPSFFQGPNLRFWDSNAWSALPRGIEGQILAMREYQQELIVAGNFTHINGIEARSVAGWDGNNWRSLNAPVVNSAYAMTEFKGELIISSFSSHGYSIYAWDGSLWRELATNLDGAVRAYAVLDDKLYVGGKFNRVNGVMAWNIIGYDGSDWFTLGDGLSGEVDSLAVYQEQLVAGGSFLSSGAVSLDGIARWDGSQWSPFGGGFSAKVRALTVFQSELIAGGEFLQAGSGLANRIARWDGSDWQPINGGVNGRVTSLRQMASRLIVGGSFSVAGGKPINNIASWDGAQWSAFGSGASGVVSALLQMDDYLVIGGVFDSVGDKVSPSLAKLKVLEQVVFHSQGSAIISPILEWPGAMIDVPPAPVRVGYTFKGWNSAADGSGSQYVGTFAMPAGGLTLYAQWTANQYRISFDSDGGSTVADMLLDYKTTVTPPSPPSRPGLIFAGWQPTLPATMPAQDISVKARWTTPKPPEPSKYWLRFDSAGGSAVDNLRLTAGSQIHSVTNPSREGYNFVGWQPSIPAVMPAQDLTLIAQWQIQQFSLEFDSQGGTAVGAIRQDFATAISEPTPPSREGYTFVGWQPSLPAFMPAQNMQFVAQWQKRERYQVQAVLSGAGQILPAFKQVWVGDEAVFELKLDNPHDIVELGGSCVAARSADKVITAAVTQDCTVLVMVFPATDVQYGQSDELVVGTPGRFRFIGGAGDKVLTEVNLLRAGQQTTLDADASRASLQKGEDGEYRFYVERTGEYRLIFKDAVSNELTEVVLDVKPFVAFLSDRQVVSSGQAVRIRVWLSDEPARYPLIVRAKADNNQLTLPDMVFTREDKRVAIWELETTQKGGSLELQANSQSVIGVPANHQVKILKDEIPLTLHVEMKQAGEATRVVDRTFGTVTVSAQEVNGHAATYRWQSDSLPLSVQADRISFDPANLITGRHSISVTALSEQGHEGEYLLEFQVISDCPDQQCGSVSGIPESHNIYSAHPHRLALCPLSDSGGDNSLCTLDDLSSWRGFVEVPGPYQLGLGTLAATQSWASLQFGLAVTDPALPDPGFSQIGVISDFEVYGLFRVGESVPVVVPLPPTVELSPSSVWRKYIDGQWQDFVINEFNTLESAAKRESGRCPAVSAPNWQSGLNPGHGCVRLTIEDGGPNDSDGSPNAVVRDPGSLAEKELRPPVPTTKPESSAGAYSGFMLFVLFFVSLARSYSEAARQRNLAKIKSNA